MLFLKTDGTDSHEIMANNTGTTESENSQKNEQLNPLNKLEQNETSSESGNVSAEIKKVETSIENSINSINDKFFRLLSGNNDLLYDIKNTRFIENKFTVKSAINSTQMQDIKAFAKEIAKDIK